VVIRNDADVRFDPVIAQLGPFQLGWHGIFTAIAVLVAVWLAGRLALQRGIPTEVVYAIAGWGVVGGLIGAQPVHRGIAFLLDHLPPQLHLVVVGRAVPIAAQSPPRAR
jgi:phosphatidylglycerol---prolipoprotein diacylglyceryl transferase